MNTDNRFDPLIQRIISQEFPESNSTAPEYEIDSRAAEAMLDRDTTKRDLERKQAELQKKARDMFKNQMQPRWGAKGRSKYDHLRRVDDNYITGTKEDPRTYEQTRNFYLRQRRAVENARRRKAGETELPNYSGYGNAPIPELGYKDSGTGNHPLNK